MVAKSCRLNNKFSPLIWSIKVFLKRDWHFRINHIYHEANYVADRMANLTISFSLGLYMFMISLESVKLFVESPFVTKKKYNIRNV